MFPELTAPDKREVVLTPVIDDARDIMVAAGIGLSVAVTDPIEQQVTRSRLSRVPKVLHGAG